MHSEFPRWLFKSISHDFTIANTCFWSTQKAQILFSEYLHVEIPPKCAQLGEKKEFEVPLICQNANQADSCFLQYY